MGQYVRGPDSWFELTDKTRQNMVPLQELAEVRFGFKTGKDSFFCVRDVTKQHLDRTPDPDASRTAGASVVKTPDGYG